MVRPLHSETSCTEFSKWLRNNGGYGKPLSSSYDSGFVTTNVDYMWKNYRTGNFLLLEEKRERCLPTYAQWEMYKTLDSVLRNSDKYYGFHLLVFERSSPKDGRMYLDGNEFTELLLIKFLQFKLTTSMYNSYFPEWTSSKNMCDNKKVIYERNHVI